MRVQKENKTVWVFAILSLLVIFALRCFDAGIVEEPDATFLYNRCYQMWDCIKHGYYPFLYYNDVGGIGYASPIFYGQLTLVPFIPFLGSISAFLKVYTLVCLVVNFLGFRSFCKRFSSYATLSAVFYVLGVPFIFMASSGMYANQLATGISWFFFGFCIDYFRDGENFAFTTLTYFLVWQANLNSAVFALAVCFCLFLVWFNPRRFRDYVRLFVVNLMLLSYNLINIVTHMDAVRLADSDTLFPGSLNLLRVVMSSNPFGGFLYRSLGYTLCGWDLCCGFISFAMLAVFLYFILSGFKEETHGYRTCAVMVLVGSVVAYIMGVGMIWLVVFDVTGAFFQFPIRYFILVWGFVVAVVSRVVRWNRLVLVALVICLLDIFIANPLSASSIEGGVDPLLLTIGHGEYAGETFVQDVDVWEEYRSSVHSESGEAYDFTNEYNGVLVDCSANPGGDILTLPKLYYWGYQAIGSDGETFPVVSGYSNYCEVDLGDYQGTLRLEYRVPSIVKSGFCLQIACLIALDICIWDKDETWKRRHPRAYSA